MKLNKKQTAAWMAVGETVLDLYMRVTDLSLPDHVAVDEAWLLGSVRRLKTLASRWAKTLPGTRGSVLNVARRKERTAALMGVLPALVAEASDETVTVTLPPNMQPPVPPEELN